MPTDTEIIDYNHVLVDRDDLKAILFQIGDQEVWIPRSLIEDQWEEDKQVEIPLWFAMQEGLI